MEFKQFLINKTGPTDLSSIYTSISNKQKKWMGLINEKHNKKLNRVLEDGRKVKVHGNHKKVKTPIINLSGVKLSEHQIDVLNKGLSFALVSKEIPVLDIVSLVEWGIQDLPEGEKNEFVV